MIDQRKDRAMGAIIGSLIGDSIGMGCHWYYNIEEQERDCVLGYQTSKIRVQVDRIRGEKSRNFVTT